MNICNGGQRVDAVQVTSLLCSQERGCGHLASWFSASAFRDSGFESRAGPVIYIYIYIYIYINPSKIKPLSFFRLIMAFAGLKDTDVTAALQACQGNLHVSGPSHWLSSSISCRSKPIWLSSFRGTQKAECYRDRQPQSLFTFMYGLRCNESEWWLRLPFCLTSPSVLHGEKKVTWI